MPVYRYDSMSKLADDVEKYKSHYYNDKAWTGGETCDQVIHHLRNGGDIKLAQRARDYLDNFNMAISTEIPIHTPSPFGGRFIIPEAILGWPEPARRLQRTMDDAAPLTVYYSNTCSAGIQVDQMIKRGMAIMAFVMAMSYIRPVKVVYFSELQAQDGWCNITFDVPTSPMSLSEAAYCTGSMSLTRGAVYAIGTGKNCGFHGGWASHYLSKGGDKRKKEYTEHLRKEFGARHDDVIIGSVYLDDPLITDPVKWLKTTLASFIGES